ncbi:MAG: hypothetical protein ACD_20C00178G0005 [uncultured bacterium]|nr:MAG: hypothetical protein ACD_20C00178G0005 [uncultured bacterium]
MIIDVLENWGQYFAGSNWQAVIDFLKSLNKETSEGDYPIKGSEIFARVMSYETHSKDHSVFEAHCDFIDIQVVLTGAEGIAWHPVKNLVVRDEYNSDNDVVFFASPSKDYAKTDVYPGVFVVLFPYDAHMPQLKVDGMPDRVKKVVVKVKTSLYQGLTI